MYSQRDASTWMGGCIYIDILHTFASIYVLDREMTTSISDRYNLALTHVPAVSIKDQSNCRKGPSL
jgi:hypothetical protein